MKKKIEVEVGAVAHDFSEALVGLVKVVKEQAKDGIQISDLGPVIAAAVSTLPGPISQFGELKNEAHDVESFMNAWALAGSKIYAVLAEKSPQPQA